MMEIGKCGCDLLRVCKILKIKQIGSRIWLLGKGLIHILFMVYEYNVIWAYNIAF